MKIAQIATITERVPPKKYGGIERVVSVLTEGLVARGHEVTLFASGDSITSARLVSVSPKSLKELKTEDPYGINVLNSLNVGLAYKMQDEFDIIHDHLGATSLPIANLAHTPVIMTYHGPFTREIQDIFGTLNKPYVVTISNGQKAKMPKAVNYAGNVYNGLPLDTYPFGDKDKGYLLFVGRITLEKGVHRAIRAAQILDLPLIIAAKLETSFQPDIDYFKKYVQPFLSDKIRWIGEVDEVKRNKLMSEALCCLHPVSWPEPFGLTLIESMACGSPVVAFNLGSIPEVINHGKTGYVVKSITEMVKAIKNIKKIKRSDCRTWALENFSAQRMIDDYEEIYSKILERVGRQNLANQQSIYEKAAIQNALNHYTKQNSLNIGQSSYPDNLTVPKKLK